MANILISELRPAGSEFFDVSESFMDDLVDSELLDCTRGGTSPATVSSIKCAGAIGVAGAAVGNYIIDNWQDIKHGISDAWAAF
ncbi:MAG TPA: hypothetical protein VK184_03430 [Nostocaceae cyanobacterium]|nr:hypothetical protein [Nostocaceae cyanobacterium]